MKRETALSFGLPSLYSDDGELGGRSSRELPNVQFKFIRICWSQKGWSDGEQVPNL